MIPSVDPSVISGGMHYTLVVLCLFANAGGVTSVDPGRLANPGDGHGGVSLFRQCNCNPNELYIINKYKDSRVVDDFRGMLNLQLPFLVRSDDT
jgi:hypothetical protein